MGIVIIVLLALLGIAGVAVLARVLVSGTTPAIRNGSDGGSVAELTSIRVDGADLWLLIRGRSVRNPVLLFLHGGPGTAMIGVFRRYQKLLEEHFIVVQWDQRGAGLSGGADPRTLTLERFLQDGLAVTGHLKERFAQEKIVLVGHSWGSAFGYILAHRYPEHYSVFFGINQVSNRTEERCYAATLRRARETGDTHAVEALEALGPPPYRNVAAVNTRVATAETGKDSVAGMLERYRWSDRLGGDSGKINIVRRFVRDLLFHREYRFRTIAAWMKNKSVSLNATYETFIQKMDLMAEGTGFTIPVFFLLGDHDLLTIPEGAEELMERIAAPGKGVYRLDAAHEIPWERTEEYQRVVIETAAGVTDRGDACVANPDVGGA